TTLALPFPLPAPLTPITPSRCAAPFLASASSGPLTAIVFISPPLPRTFPEPSRIACGPGRRTPRRNSRKTSPSARMMTMTSSNNSPQDDHQQALSEENYAPAPEVTGGTGRRPLQTVFNDGRDYPRLSSFAFRRGTLTANQ